MVSAQRLLLIRQFQFTRHVFTDPEFVSRYVDEACGVFCRSVGQIHDESRHRFLPFIERVALAQHLECISERLLHNQRPLFATDPIQQDFLLGALRLLNIRVALGHRLPLLFHGP